jgi:DNA-binding transcriptional LysR family regulator
VELRHFRYFIAIAEELHFGRAAARLRVAQPSLSQQVKQLEQELGVELLARTRRNVTLTEPGRLFLVEARHTVRQAANAARVARRAAAGDVGRLRVGYGDAALWGVLPAVLRAYRERHPGVALTLRELLPAQQMAGLRAGTLDVGIGPPTTAPSVDTHPFSDDPFVVALPAEHPLAARPAIELADLARERWVLVPTRAPSRIGDVVLTACAAAGFTPRVDQEARQLDALVALVSAGLGITLVPGTAERVGRPGVVFRPLAGLDLRFPLVATWRREGTAPTVASFVGLLREVVPPPTAERNDTRGTPPNGGAELKRRGGANDPTTP